MKPIKFIHRLDEVTKAIGGWYVFSKEDVLDLRGSKVLFFMGHGIIDSSCCGFGGCRFALVVGIIIAYKYCRDEEGREISLVAPITDRERRDEITELLSEREGINQVVFGIPSE